MVKGYVRLRNILASFIYKDEDSMSDEPRVVQASTLVSVLHALGRVVGREDPEL